MVVLVGGESDMVEFLVLLYSRWGMGAEHLFLSESWGLPLCPLFVARTPFFADILSVFPCLALVVLERVLGWSDSSAVSLVQLGKGAGLYSK